MSIPENAIDITLKAVPTHRLGVPMVAFVTQDEKHVITVKAHSVGLASEFDTPLFALIRHGFTSRGHVPDTVEAKSLELMDELRGMGVIFPGDSSEAGTPAESDEMLCTECGRPLMLTKTGRLWRDAIGDPWHRDAIDLFDVAIPTGNLRNHRYCVAEAGDDRMATAPEVES